MNSRFFGFALLALPICVQAFTGFSWSHKDWEIACDNTGTCRAAGYQSDGDDKAVSILLTRKAGPNTPVIGEAILGSYDVENTPIKFQFFKNGKNLGWVLDPVPGRDASRLRPEQVQAILANLAKETQLEFRVDGQTWTVSDQGLRAVLLKMDEFQGRLNTPGALVRKGSKLESTIPMSRPVSVVQIPKLSAVGMKLAPTDAAQLAAELRGTLGPEDECMGLEPEMDEEGAVDEKVSKETFEAKLRTFAPNFGFDPLDDRRVLVSVDCWRAAYNAGSGVWVISRQKPWKPELVTLSATDVGQGEVSESHKGRGLGDCWGQESWAWNGHTMVATGAGSTGMCRLVQAGGAWSLPTLVIDVRRSKQ